MSDKNQLNDHDQKVDDLNARLMADPELIQRFQKDPHSVLKEFGVSVDPNLEVEVVQNTKNKVYWLLPHLDLAGGSGTVTAPWTGAGGGRFGGIGRALR